MPATVAQLRYERSDIDLAFATADPARPDEAPVGYWFPLGVGALASERPIFDARGMAQSVWMAVPSNASFKVVDITGKPEIQASDLAAMATAPNGPGAIVAAVALAAGQQRRVISVCRFNMDILLIVE